jgi:Skp family chaperone for outer membrane proteins
MKLKIKNRLALWMFVAIFMSCSLSAFAEYKIATVDFIEIINSSSEAKTAKTKLEKLSEESKKAIENLQAELAPLQDKVKEGKIKPGTPEGNEVRAKTKELVDLMQTKEEELQKKYAELNQTIAKKAVKIVSDYAKSNSIDLVLEKSELRRGYVLFAVDSTDITAEILKLMNK